MRTILDLLAALTVHLNASNKETSFSLTPIRSFREGSSIALLPRRGRLPTSEPLRRFPTMVNLSAFRCLILPIRWGRAARSSAWMVLRRGLTPTWSSTSPVESDFAFTSRALALTASVRFPKNLLEATLRMWIFAYVRETTASETFVRRRSMLVTPAPSHSGGRSAPSSCAIFAFWSDDILAIVPNARRFWKPIPCGQRGKHLSELRHPLLAIRNCLSRAVALSVQLRATAHARSARQRAGPDFGSAAPRRRSIVNIKNALGEMPQSLQFDLSVTRECELLVDFIKTNEPSRIEFLDPTNTPFTLVDLLVSLNVPYDVFIADAGLIGQHGRAIFTDRDPRRGTRE